MGKRHLEVICGNELAMQKKSKFKYTVAKDDSSLLLHSDVWSGCSAYEVVLWIILLTFLKQNQCSYYQKKKTKLL